MRIQMMLMLALSHAALGVERTELEAAASAGRLFSDKWIADRSTKLQRLAEQQPDHRFAAIRSLKDQSVLGLYYSFPISGDGCEASEAELQQLAKISGAVIPYFARSMWRSTSAYPQPEVLVLMHGDTAFRKDDQRTQCDAQRVEHLASVPAYMQTAMFIGQPIDLYTWKQFLPPVRVEIDYGLAFGGMTLERRQAWQINPDVATPRLHKVVAAAIDGIAPLQPATTAQNRRVEVWIGRDAEDLAALVRRSQSLQGDYSTIPSNCEPSAELGFCPEGEVARGRIDALPIAAFFFIPDVTIRSPISDFVLGVKYGGYD
jgi:hypothetical protein